MLLVVVAINSQVVSTIYLMPSLVREQIPTKSFAFPNQFDRGIPVEPWFAGFIAIPAGTSTAPWSLACVVLDRQACVWGEKRVSVFPPLRSFPPSLPPLLLSLAPLAGFPSSIFEISINLQASHLNCCNLISYAIRCLRLKKRELVILLSYHRPWDN